MEEKVARVQECYWLRRKMAAFVSAMCEEGHGKNGGEASKLRDAGNAKFAAKEDQDSIKLYTQVGLVDHAGIIGYIVTMLREWQKCQK